MRQEARKFHGDVLGLHNQFLFETLIFEHHISSENLKEVEFDGYDRVRGYFATKDRQKYFIDEELITELPIRIGDQNQELLYKEDIVIRPLNPRPFKIVPAHTIPIRELVDNFVNFEHSEPMQWKLLKFVGLMGYIGKTFICVATQPNFGKSSMFDVVHGITNMSPVFKPRSIPGVLNQINGTGNIVFDEVAECKKEIKDIMEEFALQVGGGKPYYINGALASHQTKKKYNCSNQSITFLYNTRDSYKDPDKTYFEVIFENNKAIDDRFLKLCLSGELTERFSKDFDLMKEAEDNRAFYISLAKELIYLQQLKANNGYTRRYQTLSFMQLTGRRKIIYNEITWLMDMYCETQEEYSALVLLLDEAIIKYREMVSTVPPEIPIEVIK